MESTNFSTIVYNQPLLSSIDYDNCNIPELKEILKENEKLSEYLAEKYNSMSSKRGRPRNKNYIFEENIPINSVNDLAYMLKGQGSSREPITTTGRVAIKKISNFKPKKKSLK